MFLQGLQGSFNITISLVCACLGFADNKVSIHCIYTTNIMTVIQQPCRLSRNQKFMNEKVVNKP